MKAEKARDAMVGLCHACDRVKEIMSTGICAPVCVSEYRLDEEIEAELARIEELAAKGLRAEQAEREIEAEIKSHTERGDYADRKGDKEESQRLWDMVAGLYIALDKLTGEGADRLKGAE